MLAVLADMDPSGFNAAHLIRSRDSQPGAGQVTIIV
jgi:hypothetical protein